MLLDHSDQQRAEFFGYEPAYLIASVAVWVGLIVIAAWFVRSRVWQSKRRFSRTITICVLIGWPTLTTLTMLELGFALIYDTTDSFNVLTVSKRWQKRHVWPNDRGYRDRKQFTLDRPLGKKRVLIIGDSFAFGHGIPRIQDRFADILERRLELSNPGRFQLYNMALPGMGTVHQVALLEELVEAGFETDVVLLFYVPNDLEDLVPENQAIMASIYLDYPPWLIRHTFLYNFLYYRFKQFSRPEVKDSFHWLANAYRGEAWQEEKKRLDTLRRLCESNGSRFGMVLFPFLHNLGAEYGFRDAHRVVTQYCHGHQVPIVDLLDVMAEHREENLVVNRFDLHPNERAHSLAATSIWDQEILVELLGPLRASEE